MRRISYLLIILILGFVSCKETKKTSPGRSGGPASRTTGWAAQDMEVFGFSDPKYFSRCFKKLTGQTPSEYQESKCNQE